MALRISHAAKPASVTPMRQSISLHQFIQEVSQQLPFAVVVSISPFAMTQDAVLQFSSICSQAVAVAVQQAAIRLRTGFRQPHNHPLSSPESLHCGQSVTLITPTK
jgi:hypothetical protein